MRARAKPLVDASPLDIEFIDLPGEEIPLDDNSVDTVLMTYALCTIPDTKAAGARVGRSIIVLRTWHRVGREGPAMAKSSKSGLEKSCRRLPYESRYPGVAGCWRVHCKNR
jgi:ubiquinone/menaquinone biosynthesis C-methylase UbiE